LSQNGLNDIFSVHNNLLQVIKSKKGYKSTLALVGYLFYGVGIALFVLGVVSSIFTMLDYPYLPDSKVNETSVFLESLVPWIVISVVFLVVAPLVFRLGTDQEQKIVPSNKGPSSSATNKGTFGSKASHLRDQRLAIKVLIYGSSFS
jgi:hypothetical protein